MFLYTYVTFDQCSFCNKYLKKEWIFTVKNAFYFKIQNKHGKKVLNRTKIII